MQPAGTENGVAVPVPDRAAVWSVHLAAAGAEHQRGDDAAGGMAEMPGRRPLQFPRRRLSIRTCAASAPECNLRRATTYATLSFAVSQSFGKKKQGRTHAGHAHMAIWLELME